MKKRLPLWLALVLAAVLLCGAAGVALSNTNRCYRCFSPRTVPIRYGTPAFGVEEEMDKSAQARGYVLGGCVIGWGSAARHCLACNRGFGLYTLRFRK